MVSDTFAYWLFRLFSRHISRTQSFLENRHFKNQASVALNPFVSLLGHFVTRGGKKSGTDGRTALAAHAHARRGLMKALKCKPAMPTLRFEVTCYYSRACY